MGKVRRKSGKSNNNKASQPDWDEDGSPLSNEIKEDASLQHKNYKLAKELVRRVALCFCG